MAGIGKIISGIGLRLFALVAITACSEAAIESYGCACAGRSYTASELAEYRAGAQKNDLEALAQMEEYHRLRSWEHAEGSEKYKVEAKIERSYRDRRLALNDPDAIADEVYTFIAQSKREETPSKERIENLKQAQGFTKRRAPKIMVSDVWDPDRKSIRALDYIDRELKFALQLGDQYYATRSAMEYALAEQGTVKP
jgi:hypothetical protein